MDSIFYYEVERWKSDKRRREIPCVDTFYLRYLREEEIKKQIRKDISGSSVTLRYHVNCAQSKDLGFLIDTLLENKESLSGRDIEILTTTILEYSLNRINLDYVDCYRRQRISPINRINLRVIQMDNENSNHKATFLRRYFNTFNGTLCNISGAIVKPRQTANLLIQTTSDNGWIQTDNEWIVRRLTKSKNQIKEYIIIKIILR